MRFSVLALPRILPCCLLLGGVLMASTAVAEVYRYTDQNGNVVFTDEPRDGAERITVQEVPTVDLPDGPITEDVLLKQAVPSSDQKEKTGAYQSLGFVEPENNSAFWSGSGNIALRVSAEPALRENHLFEVALDGEPVGRNRSGIFNVRHINRGTHTATVRIVRNNGDILERGPSITFTVHRPSVNN